MHQNQLIHCALHPSCIHLGVPADKNPETPYPVYLGNFLQVTKIGLPAEDSSVPILTPQLVRKEPISEKSDIFQLGCILYQALTGREAFPAGPEQRAAIVARSLNLDFLER
jgi:serine/threonine protein kinase